MNSEDLATTLPILLDAGSSVEIKGPPGVGKSTIIEDLITKLSARDGEQWGFSTLFLATQTPSDLLGYLMPETKTFNGKETRVSTFTMPLWMLTSDGTPVHNYRRGILFLDEYGQGEADVKRASAELLLNKRLGPWSLPLGWCVVAASNRNSDRSGVTKSFDFVINRRVEIELQPDVGSWTNWASANNISPLAIAFANHHPHIVFSDTVPDKQGPWCTPRSLVMADKILQAMGSDGEIPDGSLANEVVSGMIGSAAAAQLFAFVRLEREMPKFEEIIASPDKCHVPDRPDGKMLVCYNLAARATNETIAPCIEYIERFGQEFAATFIKSASKRNFKFALNPAFKKWCSNNNSLMSALA